MARKSVGSWRVTLPGMPMHGAVFAPDRASTHEDAAALYRRTMPRHDQYQLRVHRLGDDEYRDQFFPPTKKIAA